MPTRSALLVMAAATFAAGTSQAEAITQEAGAVDRGTAYFDFGIGAGGSNLAEEALASVGAGTLAFRAGAVIGDSLLIGSEFLMAAQYNQWSESTYAAAGLSSLLVQGIFYPTADSGLSLAAGGGWGSALSIFRLADRRNGDPNFSATKGNGISWMAGVGWDFGDPSDPSIGLQLRYDGTQSDNLGTSHMGSLQLWFL